MAAGGLPWAAARTMRAFTSRVPTRTGPAGTGTTTVRFNKLDLNLLVALDVLLKERSVTRAAEALNLSASAMSNALARLREYFEDELLVQIGRKMELTPRAQTLQETVRDLLLRIDSTDGWSAPLIADCRSINVASIGIASSKRSLSA